VLFGGGATCETDHCIHADVVVRRARKSPGAAGVAGHAWGDGARTEGRIGMVSRRGDRSGGSRRMSAADKETTDAASRRAATFLAGLADAREPPQSVPRVIPRPPTASDHGRPQSATSGSSGPGAGVEGVPGISEPGRPRAPRPRAIRSLRDLRGALGDREFASMQDLAVAAVREAGYPVSTASRLFRVPSWRLEEWVQAALTDADRSAMSDASGESPSPSPPATHHPP